jgi:hypothetical protein
LSTTPSSSLSGNSSRARRARGDGVTFRAHHHEHAVAGAATRVESDTGITGEESRIIQSNSGSMRCSNSFRRPLASKLGSARNHVARGNEEQVLHLAALQNGKFVAFAQQIVGEPRCGCVPRWRCMPGLRRSASMTRTRRPCCRTSTCRGWPPQRTCLPWAWRSSPAAVSAASFRESDRGASAACGTLPFPCGFHHPGKKHVVGSGCHAIWGQRATSVS